MTRATHDAPNHCLIQSHILNQSKTTLRISRAARCLEAQPILECSAEVCHTLDTLHPPEPLSSVPTSEMPPAAVTEQILAKVLKSLPHGSAVEPSGWTYEHIKAATSTSEGACVAVLRLVAAVCRDLPHRPHLLDARLLPLAKPFGVVRPIAVGEVWYWITVLVALASCPNAGRSLVPLQAAIGLLGESHIVGHAIRFFACPRNPPVDRWWTGGTLLRPCSAGTRCWQQ
jgi:hypothetical protein